MKIIIITGPSGSGKTSLGDELLKNLRNSYIISTDDFYKTGLISNLLSLFINSYFDKKISHNDNLLKKYIKTILKNKSIDYYYKYDFKKKQRDIIYTKPKKIQILIIEGIFVMDLINFLSKYDYLLINLKINKSICMKRVIYRDQLERGKDKKKSIKDFKNAWKIYEFKKNYNINIDNQRLLVFKQDSKVNDILQKLNMKI